MRLNIDEGEDGDQYSETEFKKTLIPTEKSKPPTNVWIKQIYSSIPKIYISYFEKKSHLNFNEKMRRIILSFLQFETISRKRSYKLQL